MRFRQGFTLIELIVALAIVGLLAAIALPAYQNYIVRAQISEGMMFASAIKAEALEYHASTGAWPTNIVRASLSGTYVSQDSITPKIYSDGTIMVLFGNKAHPVLTGQGIELHPTVNANGSITWQCGGVAYRAGGNGSLEYTIGPYLPSSCREMF